MKAFIRWLIYTGGHTREFRYTSAVPGWRGWREWRGRCVAFVTDDGALVFAW